MKTIRIGSGAGYAGDRLEPSLELIEKGNLDYISYECLAERTIAIGQQAKLKDPTKGYNGLLEHRMEKALPLAWEHKVKIITNMGSANPEAAAQKCVEIARKHGLKVGGGILLYGPPGTGKTFIAKAVAGELDLPFYTITAADIFGKYVGESENNIRDLFAEARKNPLSVVFIDELETIFRKRTGDIHETTQKVISVILQELDGVKDGKNPFLLLGATNAPWMIDEAFMRTGRFDVKAYVGLPDLPAREQIIRNAFKHVEYPVDEDAIMYLASATGKCSGADINGIVQSIRQTAFERHADRYTIELFRSCTQHIAPSCNEETLRKIEEWERQNEITRE